MAHESFPRCRQHSPYVASSAGSHGGPSWFKIGTDCRKTGAPMTEETLRQLLARVHERLSATHTVDPETREMLATVMRDIDAALVGSADSVTSAPVSAEARVASAQPRLEALAVRFEAEHPSLARLLRQIGELL